jgi:6-phospho-3-hexuloisomerase
MKKIFEELTTLNNEFDHSQLEDILKLFINPKVKNYVGFGAGRMGYSLRSFMMRLDHLGFRSFMIGDTNFPRIDPNTVAFINSSSGETQTNVLYARQAIKHGAKTVLLTSQANSTLANICDYKILYPSIQSSQLMKSIYEQFTFILFDFICESIVTRQNLNIEFIENNHSISE